MDADKTFIDFIRVHPRPSAAEKFSRLKAGLKTSKSSPDFVVPIFFAEFAFRPEVFEMFDFW